MSKIIRNLSINGSTTDISVIIAHNWLSRLKGLLGTLSLNEKTIIWLKPCNSIHTIGMLYSIDVLFLDQNNCVINIFENVKPFRFRLGSKQTTSTVELASGVTNKMGIKSGDTLIFD